MKFLDFNMNPLSELELNFGVNIGESLGNWGAEDNREDCHATNRVDS